MMNRKNTLLSLLSGLALSVAATFSFADEHDSAEEEIEKRWYQIELLIFKQKESEATVNEDWPDNIALSYPGNLTILKTMAEYEQEIEEEKAFIAEQLAEMKAANETSSAPQPPTTDSTNALDTATDEEDITEENKEIPFIKLSRAHKELIEASGKLKWAKKPVLFHEVWRQEFIRNDNDTPSSILVKGGDLFGDHNELEGSISVKFSRYLHFTTNLWWSSFALSGSNESFSDDDEELAPKKLWPSLPLSPDALEKSNQLNLLSDYSTTDRYNSNQSGSFNLGFNSGDYQEDKQLFDVTNIATLKQTRRMRSNELHYIDHPILGILVKITPYELPEDEESADTSNNETAAVIP